MNKITFKLLSESDLELLHQWFHVPHVKQWYARGESYTKEMIREKYLPRIGNPDIPNYIIYVDEHPIGYIQYYILNKSLPEDVNSYQHPVFAKHDAKNMVGIDLFIADEKYLGRGISSDALECFIKQHLQHNFAAVVVDPLKSNHRAIAFFIRNKFKKLMGHNGKHELMMLEL
jgi:aminoglycoside 6'-N-acetyltransferase